MPSTTTLVVYGLLALSSISFAKPVPASKNIAIDHAHIANVLHNPVDKQIFEPHMAHIRQRHSRFLQKRQGTWTVRAGDTGNAISKRLGISFIQLAFLNPTVRWRFLQIGQQLNVPSGAGATGSKVYNVVAGDTGNAIAASNGITFAMLSAFNPDVNWWNLQIGQPLVVPSARLDTSRLAAMQDMTTLQDDASVPAMSFSTATPTAKDSLFLSTSTSATLSQATVDVEEAAESSTTHEKSPFLTSGGPPLTESKRNVSPNGNDRDVQIVKVHLVRSEGSAQSAGKSQNRRVAGNKSTQMKTYTVKQGDTGNAISAAFGITFGALSAANPGVAWTNLQIGQILNLPSGVNVPIANDSSEVRTASGRDAYTLFTGNPVSASPAYPSSSSWLDFTTLWISNLPNIGKYCSFDSGTVAPNTNGETIALRSAIQTIAAETGVHASFILAMIMQESMGCVRAPTTSSWEGIRNPGLMQSFKGTASCNENGTQVSPCPDQTIKKMIREGVVGNQGVGVIPAMKQAAKASNVRWPLQTMRSGWGRQMADGQGPTRGAGMKGWKDDAMIYYQAARIYNSGSLPENGDLSGSTGSTRCYVSDIVNRLMGWVNAPRGCSLN